MIDVKYDAHVYKYVQRYAMWHIGLPSKGRVLFNSLAKQNSYTDMFVLFDSLTIAYCTNNTVYDSLDLLKAVSKGVVFLQNE